MTETRGAYTPHLSDRERIVALERHNADLENRVTALEASDAIKQRIIEAQQNEIERLRQALPR